MKTLLFLIPIALGLLWKSCQEETPLKNACGGCPKDSTRIEADILYSMPSPAFLLHSKENKNFYQKDFFLDSRLPTSKNTEAAQALRYGALWADVSVMYLFEDRTNISPHLGTLEELHQKLAISYPIDFKGINQIKETHLDSLSNQLNTNFKHLACCLASQKRTNSSVLILVGAWLEYMNYLCLLYEKYPNEELKGVIGYDKIVLEQLIMVGDASPIKLPYSYMENLKSLSNIYNKLEIRLPFRPIKTIEINGELIIVDDDFTPYPVNVSDSDFLVIRQEIKRLRKELLVND